MPIDDLIERMRHSSRCRVLPPSGQPVLPQPFVLPDDAKRFYELCGGVEFRDHEDEPWPRYQLLGPDNVVNVCMATVGDEFYLEPPLTGWYGIGKDDGSDCIALDCNADRLGHCYDVFHETFADPFAAKVIALSFTEFVENLFDLGRNHWLKPGGYGYYGED